MGYKVICESHSEEKGPCKEQGTVVNGRVERILGLSQEVNEYRTREYHYN